MGSVQIGKSFSRGLYGFDKGVGTFGLEAKDGSAWFGIGKRILIDATSATISGGYGNKD
jgi:hypothetical protein